MEPSAREKRHRRQFGPAPGSAPEPWRRRVRLPPPRRVAPVVALLLVAGSVAAFLGLTPHDHVAPGCWWWTARTVGEVVPDEHGCLRGYVAPGGELTETRDQSSDVRLPFAYADPDKPPLRGPCPFVPGDAAVVHYHSVFDDGRVIVVVEDCR